ncbi:MAG TPA: glutaredoxin [Acidimicrobiia bacterium]|nr:glutaredoxin [Acidimicrobiia bacterium]
MEPIPIALVTAPGCHFCDDAMETLEALGDDFPITVEVIPLASDAGRAWMVEHRVPFPPILIVDGSFFGFGRISRRRLERRLTDLRAARVVS